MSFVNVISFASVFPHFHQFFCHHVYRSTYATSAAAPPRVRSCHPTFCGVGFSRFENLDPPFRNQTKFPSTSSHNNLAKMGCNDCSTAFTKYLFVTFSAVSCLFFMIGALGYTHNKDTMKNISWFYLTYPGSGGNKIYYSLKGQYIEQLNNSGDYASRTEETRYDKCNSDGYAAYVLVVIACLCSLCCAFLSGALIKNDFTFGQFIGCGLAGLATFMSGIALAVFMGDCQSAMKKFFDNYPGYEEHWAPGAVLTAVAMVMMFIVSVSMFLTAKFCSSRAADSDRVKILSEPEDTV